MAIHASEGSIYEIRAAFKAELLHAGFLVCLPHLLKNAATVSVAPVYLHQTLLWLRRPIAKHPRTAE